MWSSGTRSAQCPAPLCKPSLTGSRDGASRTSAVAIRASAPNHRRNATWLAPRACRLLRRGRGRPTEPKALKKRIRFSSTGSSAERCERRFLVASGGNSWRPGSHVISDLKAERSRQGPEAAVPAPWGVFPGHLRASVISSQGYSMAKHHGHHRWALAGWQARPARARCALEICPRGPRRQVGPGLGSWLCPHRSLEPGSHSVSWVEYLSQLERVASPPPPPTPLSEGTRTLTEQQLRKVIQRKLVAYKRQDQAKGLRFSLKVDHILALK